jgi:hypothetical protein
MSEYAGEWSVEQWQKAWTVHVGRAYACDECGTMIMVTKGGTGVLEPQCCGKPMREVSNPDEEIRDQ